MQTDVMMFEAEHGKSKDSGALICPCRAQRMCLHCKYNTEHLNVPAFPLLEYTVAGAVCQVPASKVRLLIISSMYTPLYTNSDWQAKGQRGAAEHDLLNFPAGVEMMQQRSGCLVHSRSRNLQINVI